MSTLKNLRNHFSAVLTRDEMKNVVGGYVEPDPNDNPHPCDNVGIRDLYCCRSGTSHPETDCFDISSCTL